MTCVDVDEPILYRADLSVREGADPAGLLEEDPPLEAGRALEGAEADDG